MKRLLVFCVFALAAVVGPSVALGADTEIPVKTDATATAVEAEANSEAEADASAATEIVAAKGSLLTLDSKSIDVLVDVLLVNDIGGRVDGVYEDANALLQTAIEADVRKATARNAEISNVVLSSGILLGEDTKLVNALNGKATESEFKGKASNAGNSVAIADHFAPYFRSVVKGSAAGRRRATHFDVALPSDALPGSSRYLLFVQSSARHVPFGKTLAIGVATGMATGFVYMPMSGGSVTIALIDKQDSKVLWAMQRQVKDFDQIQILTKKMVHTFSRALPAGPEPAPVVVEPDATGRFKNLRDAKLALRAEKITRDQYDNAATEMQKAYWAALATLRDRKALGEISDAAFQILTVQAKLDYTGG